MPQSVDIYDETLVDLNSWQILHPDGGDIGGGMGISHCYPQYALVYSYQAYSGAGICNSWHPVAEASFSRLMAYACAVRWDSENGY